MSRSRDGAATMANIGNSLVRFKELPKLCCSGRQVRIASVLQSGDERIRLCTELLSNYVKTVTLSKAKGLGIENKRFFAVLRRCPELAEGMTKGVVTGTFRGKMDDNL